MEGRGHPAGLCGDCVHHRLTGNRRGSRFYLCELASTDSNFRRYPPLPVIRCSGHERSADPWAEYGEAPSDTETSGDEERHE